jgi:hypothetical protein
MENHNKKYDIHHLVVSSELHRHVKSKQLNRKNHLYGLLID